MPNKFSEKPFFSIVIPSLNEEKHLPLLLEDLTTQTNSSYEVIHVDGNSDDETVKEAGKFKNDIAIESYVVDQRNVSYQRNFGAQKAKGEWVIFMDSDNRLPDYFLDGIKYQLAKNPEVDVFTTWVLTEKGATINQAIEKSINFAIELYKTIGKDVAIGALIGARRQVVESVKYDETQRVYEDALFINDAIDEGFTFDAFKEPRYFFSLRRLKKEGTLKMARTIALLNLNYLQGKDFSEIDHGYVMEGGSYYEKAQSTPLGSLLSYIKKAPKKQRHQARKLWESIKSELEIG